MSADHLASQLGRLTLLLTCLLVFGPVTYTHTDAASPGHVRPTPAQGYRVLPPGRHLGAHTQPCGHGHCRARPVGRAPSPCMSVPTHGRHTAAACPVSSVSAAPLGMTGVRTAVCFIAARPETVLRAQEKSLECLPRRLLRTVSLFVHESRSLCGFPTLCPWIGEDTRTSSAHVHQGACTRVSVLHTPSSPPRDRQQGLSLRINRVNYLGF